ncbi:hypothetical protein Dimus_006981 [Dionaea muscipula]
MLMLLVSNFISRGTTMSSSSSSSCSSAAAAAAGGAAKQFLVKPKQVSCKAQLYPRQGISKQVEFRSLQLPEFSSSCSRRTLPAPVRSSADDGSSSTVPLVVDYDDNGVSLGTMKLPPDTDIPRFETLLFQWANSLCQGASLPLPLPLKIDKIKGGVRLGFVTSKDGKTQVLVHIDCVVSPATGTSATPIFRALRNGAQKDKTPPGEPRIMKSLLSALKKSVQIARV